MPYRFTPGPFSGPAPLLHPTPPPLRSGRSASTDSVRSVTREGTRALAEQEQAWAPDPGRYRPKPSSASGGPQQAAKAANGAADTHHDSHVPPEVSGDTGARVQRRPVPAPRRPREGSGGSAALHTSRAPQGQVSAAPGHVTEGPDTDRVRVGHNGATSDEEHRNEVVVAGRITAEPRFRELPSGDHLATWRICVARHPSTRFRGRRVDSITCVSFDEGLHEHLRGWRLGDIVDVRGALRRRTWRGTAGPRSVCEVEATSVRFLRARRKGER